MKLKMVRYWLALLVTARLTLGRTREIGIAINTGDRDVSIDRVRYSVGEDGWARPQNFGTSKVDIAVYSSTKSGWMPWGSLDAGGKAKRCVPVSPCCGGEDLGSSLVSAQLMREHTWRRMLEDFSEETEWFVSTEDDAWFNFTRLSDLIDNLDTMKGKGGDNPESVKYVSVGIHPEDVWGAFVIFNRPLLRMLSNDTLLGQCRTDFLTPPIQGKKRAFFRGKYPGAPYNLDQFLAYCLVSYFPKVFTETKFVRQHFFAIKRGIHHPHKFWYNSPTGWEGSLRAPELLASMTQEERDELVGMHHVTVEDMAYLESGTESTIPITRATRCDTWINPFEGHTRKRKPVAGHNV